MNIAGILVHAYPDTQDKVRATLGAMGGVELHHETDDGRFIITVEDTDNVSCDDTIVALDGAPGIASTTLAYHSFEPDLTPANSELAAVPASQFEETDT